MRIPFLSSGLQAEYAVRMQLSALLNGIPVSIWYDWKNDGIDSADFEQNCGIVTNSLEPKPAYRAFKTLCTQLNGFALTHRIEMKSENDYILLFSNQKGIFRICVWTTAKSHVVKLDLTAAGPATIDGTDGFGKPFDLNSGKDFLNIILASMPQYLTIPCGIRLY
jgi:polysaccharide biosynthesis protein PslG